MKILPLLILLMGLPIAGMAEQNKLHEHATQGNEAYSREEYDKAKEHYNKALELEPRKAALLYNQANVLFRQEKYPEAMELYQKAIKAGPRHELLSGIYFNAGNTALQIAVQQTAEKEELVELQKSLSYYEKSFEMYRNSLEHARAASIAQGRNVQEAGLYARQNWALARESWTAAWEKIRALERKNLKLEDGVESLLMAQVNLLPSIERTYLNSLSEDILQFNLKRLAEYQLDYHADILALKELATGEEEKLQDELANLKENKEAPQPEIEQEISEIEKRVSSAVEISKAATQAASLDEWIVDGLKRGLPLQAWKNSRQMIELLQGLTSYLKESDPGIMIYGGVIKELGETEALLNQAATLAEIKESDDAVSAHKKRVKLSQAKINTAGAALNRINLLLEQIKEAKQANVVAEEEKAASSALTEAPATSGGPSSPTTKANEISELLNKIATELVEITIDELQNKNNKISNSLEDKSSLTEESSNITVNEELAEVKTALLWYQHLSKPTVETLASLIKDVESVEDLLEGSIDLNERGDIKSSANSLSINKPERSKIEISLFQLKKTQLILEKKLEESSETSPARNLSSRLQKNIAKLEKEWLSFQGSMGQTQSIADKKSALSSAENLRLALVRNLLIFSPDAAISLYYDRVKELHNKISELLPADGSTIHFLDKRYTKSAQEAAALNSLLEQYFTNQEESISNLDNQEQQEAYAESLGQRRKSVELMQRFIDAGREGSKLLSQNKYQMAELLLTDMANSTDKSRLAFAEQPKESDKIIMYAIMQQKKLEEQCRSASEAVSVEGDTPSVVPFVSQNQSDINESSVRAKESIKQTVGMAEVPTHGQASQPQAGAGQQMDTNMLNESIDKISQAQTEMVKVENFIQAAEFHNTLSKHQEIINLLTEALELLKSQSEKGDEANKQGQKKDKGEGEQGQSNKDEQGSDQDQQGDKGQGEQDRQNQNANEQNKDGSQPNSHPPKKPLELTPQEAKALLQQLNQKDSDQQTEHRPAAKGQKTPINTPRPW